MNSWNPLSVADDISCACDAYARIRKARRELNEFIAEWDEGDGVFTSRQLQRMLAPNIGGREWSSMVRHAVKSGKMHLIPSQERTAKRLGEYAPGPAPKKVVIREEIPEVSGPTVEEIVESLGDAFKYARGEFE